MMENGTNQRKPEGDSRRNTAIGFVIGMSFGGLIDLFTGDLGIGTLSGMIIGSILGYYGPRNIRWMEYPPGVFTKVALAAGFFSIALFGAAYLLDHELLDGYQPILALIPLLPGLLLVYTIGYAFSTLSEQQRRIQVEGLAIGFGFSIVLLLTAGLLGLAGVLQPTWVAAPVVMVFCWVLGKLFTRWKYRY